MTQWESDNFQWAKKILISHMIIAALKTKQEIFFNYRKKQKTVIFFVYLSISSSILNDVKENKLQSITFFISQ